MGFMYGNITQHIPRTNFKFSAVYPSRRAVQEDQKRYEEYQKDIQNNPKPTYVHSININEYILIDYTIKPLFHEDDLKAEEFFMSNKNDDIVYQEGDTFAPADYHYTVWQKQTQKIDGVDQQVYIAIARMHSILPTFETWGTYHMDVLEPLSSNPDAFGAGKIWYYPLEPEVLLTSDDEILMSKSGIQLLGQPKRKQQGIQTSLNTKDDETLLDNSDAELIYQQ